VWGKASGAGKEGRGKEGEKGGGQGDHGPKRLSPFQRTGLTFYSWGAVHGLKKKGKGKKKKEEKDGQRSSDPHVLANFIPLPRECAILWEGGGGKGGERGEKGEKEGTRSGRRVTPPFPYRLRRHPFRHGQCRKPNREKRGRGKGKKGGRKRRGEIVHDHPGQGVPRPFLKSTNSADAPIMGCRCPLEGCKEVRRGGGEKGKERKKKKKKNGGKKLPDITASVAFSNPNWERPSAFFD